MADPSTVLNRAIDEVAARMTAGDAPADLGARVLGQIRERRVPAWMWTLKPAAVLAVLALMAMTGQLIRTSRSVDRGQTPPARITAVPAPSTVGGGVNADLEQPQRTRGKAAAARPRVSAVEAAWHERAIPALTAIEALSIDGIQPEALSIPQLVVKPLATAPLNVVPIDGSGTR